MDLKRVKLKANSPEFEEDLDKDSSPEQVCEMPGCTEPAHHKAPKSRDLSDYYHFCVKHVQEYNRAWDFFSGMAEADVEQHVKDNIYGHRPTWSHTSPGMDEHLRRQAWNFRHDSEQASAYADRETQKDDENERSKHHKKRAFNPQQKTAETEALAIMGLVPPITLEEIKKQYKMLAKKYHPDLNNNSRECEEKLKNINMSYTILKLAYEKYETIKDK